MQENNSIPNSQQPKEIPLLLRAICYFIIIKSGAKILMSLIMLIGGDSLGSFTEVQGFDTIKNGGISLQILLIIVGGISIFTGIKLMQYSRVALFVYIGVVVFSFFAPVFFSPTYQPTMTAFTFTAIPVVLLFRYYDRLT